ncbi:MAG: hypothetical protein AB7L90_13395 [Hyphomicrobiaceae bacterium]
MSLRKPRLIVEVIITAASPGPSSVGWCSAPWPISAIGTTIDGTTITDRGIITAGIIIDVTTIGIVIITDAGITGIIIIGTIIGIADITATADLQRRSGARVGTDKSLISQIRCSRLQRLQ